MLEMLDNFLFSNDDIDHDYINSDIVTLFSDDIEINITDLDNNNPDDDDDDDDDDDNDLKL